MLECDYYRLFHSINGVLCLLWNSLEMFLPVSFSTSLLYEKTIRDVQYSKSIAILQVVDG